MLDQRRPALLLNRVRRIREVDVTSLVRFALSPCTAGPSRVLWSHWFVSMTMVGGGRTGGDDLEMRPRSVNETLIGSRGRPLPDRTSTSSSGSAPTGAAGYRGQMAPQDRGGRAFLTVASHSLRLTSACQWRVPNASNSILQL